MIRSRRSHCFRLLAALTCATALLAGCIGPQKPDRPPPPPRSLDDIVHTINANAARLDRFLWCSNVSVSARMRDDAGRSHSYNLEGNFLFARPRNLRINLRHALGEEVVGIGSNDGDYWVWFAREVATLRWGRHANAGKPCSGSVPVRPDQLIAALGLTGLPTESDGLLGPALTQADDCDIISYLRRDESGVYFWDRDYEVSRVPPFLIQAAHFKDAVGRRVMSVTLGDHRAAWQNGPLVPHQIHIRWPRDEGLFNMEAIRFEGRDSAGPRAFIRPSPPALPPGVREIIQIDADCEPTTQPAAPD